MLPELIEQEEEMAGTFEISLIKDCLLNKIVRIKERNF